MLHCNAALLFVFLFFYFEGPKDPCGLCCCRRERLHCKVVIYDVSLVFYTPVNRPHNTCNFPLSLFRLNTPWHTSNTCFSQIFPTTSSRYHITYNHTNTKVSSTEVEIVLFALETSLTFAFWKGTQLPRMFYFFVLWVQSGHKFFLLTHKSFQSDKEWH